MEQSSVQNTFFFVRKTIYLYQQLLLCQPEINGFGGEVKYWVLFVGFFGGAARLMGS